MYYRPTCRSSTGNRMTRLDQNRFFLQCSVRNTSPFTFFPFPLNVQSRCVRVSPTQTTPHIQSNPLFEKTGKLMTPSATIPPVPIKLQSIDSTQPGPNQRIPAGGEYQRLVGWDVTPPSEQTNKLKPVEEVARRFVCLGSSVYFSIFLSLLVA